MTKCFLSYVEGMMAIHLKKIILNQKTKTDS